MLGSSRGRAETVCVGVALAKRVYADHAGSRLVFLAMQVQAGRYDRTITAGANPSFLARRANLRSSNVATLSQAL